MRFRWATGLLVVLATSEAVGASSWFSKAGELPIFSDVGKRMNAEAPHSVQQVA